VIEALAEFLPRLENARRAEKVRRGDEERAAAEAVEKPEGLAELSA
jgi:hypothetical protein